jgi:hypothetical protein
MTKRALQEHGTGGMMMSMLLIEIVLVVLILFDLRIAFMLKKHESAIVDLLILHPELLEEDEDGGHDV